MYLRSLLYTQAWRKEGLPLKTTSNEAAKMFDASLTQVCLITEIYKMLIAYICNVQSGLSSFHAHMDRKVSGEAGFELEVKSSEQSL